MSRRLDRGASLVRLVAIAVVAGAVLNGWLRAPDAPRPGPDGFVGRSGAPAVAHVDVDVPLPPVHGRTRLADGTREAGKSYSGTAFATAAAATWATARHVTEGCRRVELHTPGGSDGAQLVGRVVLDEATDLSLLTAPTGGGVAPAARDFLPLTAADLDGFAMGYPGGSEASVHLGYLARIAAGRADSRGRERWAAAGLWQIRTTGLFIGPDLAGISGGPLFDRAGGLVGIVVGGQPRRARVTSIDPVNLAALMATAGARADAPAWRHPGIAPDNADAVRRELIRNGLLAKVVCFT